MSTLPLLFSLQQLPISIDFHVQGQFDIQQLFVLLQLQLHLCSNLSDLTLFISQHPAAQILLLSQSSLQFINAILPATRLFEQIQKDMREEENNAIWKDYTNNPFPWRGTDPLDSPLLVFHQAKIVDSS